MKLVIVLYGLCRQGRFVDVSGHELGDVIPEEDFSFVLIVEDADLGNFDCDLVQKSSNSRAWCSRGIVSKICRCGRCWPFRPKIQPTNWRELSPFWRSVYVWWLPTRSMAESNCLILSSRSCSNCWYGSLMPCGCK